MDRQKDRETTGHKDNFLTDKPKNGRTDRQTEKNQQTHRKTDGQIDHRFKYRQRDECG
jgi:hypothetical protein